MNIYPLTDLLMAEPKVDQPAAMEAKKPPPCLDPSEAMSQLTISGENSRSYRMNT